VLLSGDRSCASDLWNTDIRVAKQFTMIAFVLVASSISTMNANTALVRVNDVTSPTFNALAQNLSRALRAGIAAASAGN
jgi:hypothetical protein